MFKLQGKVLGANNDMATTARVWHTQLSVTAQSVRAQRVVTAEVPEPVFYRASKGLQRGPKTRRGLLKTERDGSETVLPKRAKTMRKGGKRRLGLSPGPSWVPISSRVCKSEEEDRWSSETAGAGPWGALNVVLVGPFSSQHAVLELSEPETGKTWPSARKATLAARQGEVERSLKSKL